MTAVSFQLNRGQGGFLMSDVVVGSNAPAGGDVELRFNVLDANSKNMNDLDLVMLIKAFIRYVETGGGSTGGFPYVAVTLQPSGPPS
jgi:hypothetical protein